MDVVDVLLDMMLEFFFWDVLLEYKGILVVDVDVFVYFGNYFCLGEGSNIFFLVYVFLLIGMFLF